MIQKLIMAFAALACTSAFALPVPTSSDPYYSATVDGSYQTALEVDPEGEVGAGTSPPR